MLKAFYIIVIPVDHQATLINPCMTTKIKISKNVDIFAKVCIYLMHLKVERCQILCSKYIYR